MAGSNQARRAAAARGVTVTLTVQGDGLKRFADAVEELGSANARKAYVRALNHTGDKAKTRVVRALSKQVGLPVRRLENLGRIVATKAEHSSTRGEPEYVIRSTGRYIPLGEFGPKQFRFGVRTKAWGRHEHAFIFAGHRFSGQRMPGGHVFRNSGKFNSESGRDNLPLPLWGPAIPKEMVKDESKRGQCQKNLA